MNERGASAALRALAAGDDHTLDELCTWVSGRDEISGRYLAVDLREAVLGAASPHGDGGLGSLLGELASRPPSQLIAFFPGCRARESCHLPGATIGPASELASAAASERALGEWPEDGETLAVLADNPAQGRLGAIRTAAWLQTVLGAIGLAVYERSATLTPFAHCPVLGTALFLGGNGEPLPVDQALLAPGAPPAAEVSELMATARSRELILDATARPPGDLAQQRLTMAVRWLQLAASATSSVDAIVMLGVALETITGDREKGAVVERVTKRSAVFLASTAGPEERKDVYYDELKRAKKLYELRSKASHGQYDDWAAGQLGGDADREEFHRFVLDVALGFRQHARERNLQGTDDFTAWWRRVELDGIFA